MARGHVIELEFFRKNVKNICHVVENKVLCGVRLFQKSSERVTCFLVV